MLTIRWKKKKKEERKDAFLGEKSTEGRFDTKVWKKFRIGISARIFFANLGVQTLDLLLSKGEGKEISLYHVTPPSQQKL